MRFLKTTLSLVTLSFASALLASAQITYTEVDYPGSAGTGVTGINNLGEMVGEYQATFAGSNHGFTLDQGQFTSFDYPNALYTYPNGINDSAVVVGSACVTSCGFPYGLAFSYDGRTFTQISYPGQPGTEGNGINNAGDVVGRIDGFAVDRAFQFSNGRFALIRVPKMSPDEDALGINNASMIVGGLYKSEGGFWVPWAYERGTSRFLRLPIEGVAFGVNDNNMIVGWWYNGGAQVGFVWSKGRMISLVYPGAFATTALGINNAGQVVGDYTLGIATENHGFVTSPVTDADFEREGVPVPLRNFAAPTP